jgi:orotidine-5'-phosphate decarboxylase
MRAGDKMENAADPKEHLCLALDVASIEDVEALVRELAGMVGMFKIGLELFTSLGPTVIERVKSLGGKVFVDLKLHDIPNTVARATRSITRMGVSMLDVHCSGGVDMMKSAAEAARDEASKAGLPVPSILGVTVLTSLSESMLRDEIGIATPINEKVVAFAKLAQASGLDGVVASPKETGLIRSACGRTFLLVTPGIRPTGSDVGDQKRITTPSEAISLGADYIVVGRPILAAPDRKKACEQILKEIRSGLSR